MAIEKVLWDDQDGHYPRSPDFRFMNEVWANEVEDRFGAVSYLNAVDTNGVATGLMLSAINDAVVVGRGTAYDASTRTKIKVTEAISIAVSPADVGNYVVINAATIGDEEPRTVESEAHPESGYRSIHRLVYEANIEIKTSGALTDSDVRLGLILSHTAGEIPVIDQDPPNRDFLVLGSLGGTLVATPFVVVANDGSGDFADIQSAIDSLPENGGRIFVKSGIFTVTSRIQTGTKSGIQIVGSGPSTVLQLDFEANGEDILFEIGNPELVSDPNPPSRHRIAAMKVTVKAPAIEDAGTDVAVTLIRFFNAVRCVVDDVIFVDPKFTLGCVGVGYDDNTVRCAVRECDFVDVVEPIVSQWPRGIGFNGNRRGHIVGNFFSGAPQYAMIDGRGGDVSRDFTILGNIMIGGGGDRADGINWHKAAAIVGNIAENFRNGATMGTFSTTRTTKSSVGGTVMGNCLVRNNNYGVNWTGSLEHIVIGNNLRDNTLGGVAPSGVDNVT